MQAPSGPAWVPIAQLAVQVAALVWAVIVVLALRQIATARTQLAKLEVEREKTAAEVQKTHREIQELDLKLKTQPVICVEMKPEIRPIVPQGWLLTVIVEVANTGNAPARLSFEKDEPLQLFPTEFDEQGKPTFEDGISLGAPPAVNPAGRVPALILRAGGRESVPFVLRIDRAGLYLVTFRALLGSVDRESLGLAIPEWKPVSWTAKRYVWVE
jgi:hypothetical protein